MATLGHPSSIPPLKATLVLGPRSQVPRSTLGGCVCGAYYLSQQFFGPGAMSHGASKETEAEVVCLRSHSRLVVTESKSRSCDIAQLLRLSLWPPRPTHQAVSVTSQFYPPHPKVPSLGKHRCCLQGAQKAGDKGSLVMLHAQLPIFPESSGSWESYRAHWLQSQGPA